RAAHILAAAPLHLDDVGAEQCELVARIGASQHLREVENLHAFERSGHLRRPPDGIPVIAGGRNQAARLPRAISFCLSNSARRRASSSGLIFEMLLKSSFQEASSLHR